MGKVGTGYKFFICFLTGMLWGVIIGAVGISAIISYRMDGFYEEIAYLENTITDKDKKLEKLENSINQSSIVLKDIIIDLDFSSFSMEQIDKIDSISIEKAIKEKFTSLLGKEVKNLDADILMQVIDKRILKFDAAEYQLTVSKLILSDVLKLWVKVSVTEVHYPY
ncbi:hypothetical protein HZF24_01885 [Sedimentibacter hydroxybenzoicus DSM 7310]|uniref:Sporulation membrane protein YtrI C-terminal domain-containing protein n=1 Tax=Sedimentibacter hydroxybenzoicus DSM 7310 TaxID=1123245 RepID=A0A974BH87_SEDHY|nr:hypothetical protein [Sedimentibacter hydroxybenzoicus]NYB72886.1 hypothetical protein [Sedimentibacter hydroxybenzoicus DSM 7310]